MTRAKHARRVHLVVTCANRKTRPVPAPLHFRNVRGRSIVARAATWISRLEESDTEPVPARDLYAGEHWHTVRQLHRTASVAGVDATVWICSAGYGLVEYDTLVRPYAATFSGQHADTVAATPAQRGAWWAALSSWSGPQPGAPRSYTALVERDPEATFLLALSKPYLTACHDDLLAAAKRLTYPDRLAVVSVGARSTGLLAEHMLPADARLQALLGGTRQSLNVRLLTHLLAHTAVPHLDRDHLAALARTMLSSAPDLVRYDRAARTDAQVAEFIRVRLATEAQLSASRLLREYRDAGNGCEQSRFGTIYRTLRENP